ncbi:hypothetical protein Q9S36_20040 [Microbacterium sp. ARD31]|uniref:hypothetical protein n=1 Tax=Microbacterium sp. ARD31 TaxID=2962576 RepID=UPI0028824AEF|nr:hypothetical protein [Microbacterium sp. ARD31]MDT0182471.1 hypothetical protein [Microbacterium sp. ARD31]
MDPAVRALGADLWTVFSWALMWSAEQGTDGLIPRHMLTLLHPNGGTVANAEALVSVGLWEAEGDDYRVKGWERTQSLAADVEHQRERNRLKQQAHRQRARERDGVTGYVTGKSHRRGEAEAEARPGPARTSGDNAGSTRVGAREGRPLRESPDERFRRLSDLADELDSSPSAAPVTEWPVREIPA